MAKIQYISSSSIQYDSPGARYAAGPPPTKKSDPALKVLLFVGIGGVVIAVAALLIAIVALQERKDVRQTLRDVYRSNIRHAGNYISRYLTSGAAEEFDKALGAFMRQYEEGLVSERKMLDFLNVLWETALEKEMSRATIVALLRVEQNMLTAPPPELERAISYFNESSDAEVLFAGGGEEEETGGLSALFPIVSPPPEESGSGVPEEEPAYRGE